MDNYYNWIVYRSIDGRFFISKRLRDFNNYLSYYYGDFWLKAWNLSNAEKLKLNFN